MASLYLQFVKMSVRNWVAGIMSASVVSVWRQMTRALYRVSGR